MDPSGYCGDTVHKYPWFASLETLELLASPGLYLLLHEMLKPGEEKLFQTGKHNEVVLAGTA